VADINLNDSNWLWEEDCTDSADDEVAEEEVEEKLGAAIACVKDNE